MYQCTFCEDWFHTECLKPNPQKTIEELEKDGLGVKIMCRNWSAENYEHLNFNDIAFEVKTDEKDSLKKEEVKESSNSEETGKTKDIKIEPQTQDISFEKIKRSRPYNEISIDEKSFGKEENSWNMKKALKNDIPNKNDQLLEIPKRRNCKLYHPRNLNKEKYKDQDLLIKTDFLDELWQW